LIISKVVDKVAVQTDEKPAAAARKECGKEKNDVARKGRRERLME